MSYSIISSLDIILKPYLANFFDDASFLKNVLKDLNRESRIADVMFSVPLLLDLRPGVKDALRARTLLFGVNPPEEEVYIYKPRDG